MSNQVEPKDQEQGLLEAFLGCRNRSRGPVIAISERTMITNQSASELLQAPDRRMLWQWALGVISSQESGEESIVLSTGLKVLARCKAVGDDHHRLGAVVRLCVTSAKPAVVDRGSDLDGQPSEARSLDPWLVSGWIELTDSERTIAELVARGLTNKEAGREMFLSHHTVDCHLRHVFRKLGVNSRVELARIVGEHHEVMTTRWRAVLAVS